MFGFHNPHNYYKPHDNLLVAYMHLRAALRMLKNDKITFLWAFLRVGVFSEGSTHINMGRKGACFGLYILSFATICIPYIHIVHIQKWQQNK